ncbi:MAG: GNAT family N-acetyltransferase [Bacteroidales bacterium]|nr:GNAT family N-acetyltransferase [Bacteroidales bacterium]
MIELKTLNKNQLLNFINSEAYLQMPILPISRHRAISHINNPRAFDDDILLIIAYEGSQMLGYLGILPDTVQNLHVGWLSCIWVSPLARGKGIAKKMVLMAYESYQQRILITNYTPEAETLYHKLGIFEPLYVLKGKRFYRKMCLSKIIPHRFPRWANLLILYKGIDLLANLFINPVLFLSPKNVPEKIKINKLESFTEQHQHYIELHQQSIFNRTISEWLWIKNYPWLKQVNIKSDEAKRYHFSSEEKQFESVFYEVLYQNECVALMMILYKNGHLRFPYIIYNKVYKTQLEHTLSYIVKQYNPHYVSLFFSELNLPIQAFYKKTIIRKYLKTKDLDINNVLLYDGDGDAAFT